MAQGCSPRAGIHTQTQPNSRRTDLKLYIRHLHNNPGTSEISRATGAGCCSPLQINHTWTGERFPSCCSLHCSLVPTQLNGIALTGFKKVKSELYLDLFLKVNSREVKEVKRIRDISSKLQVLGWPRKFFGFFPEVLQKSMKKLFQPTQSSLGMTRNGQQQYHWSPLLQSFSTHVWLWG